MTKTKMSESEIGLVQRHLRNAMNALDATGQDDLADQVHAIFKEVAHRAFGEAS